MKEMFDLKLTLENSIMKDASSIYMGFGFPIPLEFSGGAKEEYLSCRKTAWLGGSLNFCFIYDVYGPDTIKLLNSVFVNRDFTRLKSGSSSHGLICNDKGQMLADGVIIRKGQDHFRTYFLAPVLQYFLETSGMDVKGENVSTKEYFYQIDGPKSLEILEEACQCDLHDLKFAQNKTVQISGTNMIVHRLGMSGALGYEMHGEAKDADIAYDRLKEILLSYGGTLQGMKHYVPLNHTPGGYPNQYHHYLFPWLTSGEGLAKFLSQSPLARRRKVLGSAAENEEYYYATPYDVGWGGRINYEHDFMGKEALLKISKNPPRKPVTLEWNADDVAELFASQIRGVSVEPFEAIDNITPYAD
jgi:glycine cleavage system aminomethyltransferase T